MNFDISTTFKSFYLVSLFLSMRISLAPLENFELRSDFMPELRREELDLFSSSSECSMIELLRFCLIFGESGLLKLIFCFLEF